MGGENGFTRKEGFDGPEGTVWNALVTSDADIREGGATGPGKGGVPPSSDFTSWIEKGTGIVAAVRTGKMPSQGQLDGLFKAVLKSDLLTGGVELSAEGGDVVKKVREVLDSGLAFGLEKNCK